MMGAMLRLVSRMVLLVALGSACTAGGDDGLTSLSGAYTVGPAEGGDTASDTGTAGSAGSAGDAETTMSSADATSGGDVGNALCCVPGPQAGCESTTTESCVCASQPACCQSVWTQACADLAADCGDPFCSEEPGTSEGPSTDTGVELECDPDFDFAPANPAPGVPFTTTFTDPVGLTYVGMRAEGPGGATVDGGNLQISEDMPGGPYHWSYDFDGLAAGVWTFAFTYRETENGADIVAGSCEKQF